MRNTQTLKAFAGQNGEKAGWIMSNLELHDDFFKIHSSRIHEMILCVVQNDLNESEALEYAFEFCKEVDDE